MITIPLKIWVLLLTLLGGLIGTTVYVSSQHPAKPAQAIAAPAIAVRQPVNNQKFSDEEKRQIDSARTLNVKKQKGSPIP